MLGLSALHLIIMSIEGDGSGRVAIRGSAVLIAWAMFDLAFHVIATPFFTVYVAKWFGREADTSSIREALVWSYVPIAAGVVLWIPGLVLFGPVVAGSYAPDHLGLVPIMIAVLVSVIWTLVLGVLTLAEVLGVGGWKALAVMLIASVPGLIIIGLR